MPLYHTVGIFGKTSPTGIKKEKPSHVKRVKSYMAKDFSNIVILLSVRHIFGSY